MRTIRPLSIAAAAAALFSQTAHAEPAMATDPDTIVVTASRTGETLGETLAPVTVIIAEDIERLQAQNLQQLLVGLPGVTLVNNGGPGKSTSLFIRGTESNHTIVLIDGIKVGSATTGSTAIEQLPVEQIERIELVRGPRSSLYGSEAIGGVIQIFTKRGKPGQGPTPAFALSGGNYGTGKAEASVHGGFGIGGWYNAGLSHFSTDGIHSRTSSAEQDHDGFRNTAGSAALGWTFQDGAEVSAHYLRSDGRNEYDGTTTNQSDNEQQMVGGRARFSPLGPWWVTLSAGQGQDLSENYRDPPAANGSDNRGSINTHRNHYSWQNDVQLAAQQQLSLGVDFIQDRVSGSTDYAVRERDNTGVFGQYQGGFGAHDVQLSLRSDDNEQFGSHQTGGAAYGYSFGSGLRLGASYGSAFKAPTFNDLYYPGYGVATLKPEKSRSTELSASGRQRVYGGLFNWALNGYYTEVEQLIIYNAAAGPNGAPDNIGKAEITGVEAQLGAQLERWIVQSYWNWLDPVNKADGANHDNQLPRRARQTLRLDVDYSLLSQLSVGTSLYAAGKRYDNASNATRLGGYSTLALRSSWQLTPAWQLQLKAGNALNKKYQTANTYAQEGATYLATVRYTPGARAGQSAAGQE